MIGTPVLLTSNTDATASGVTSIASAAVTPTANQPVLVQASLRNKVGVSDPTIAGCNLTWTLVGKTANESGNSWNYLWRGVGAAPTTDAIIITRASTDTWGANGHQVVTVPGVDPTTPLVAANTVIAHQSGAATATQTINYAQAFATGGAGLAFFMDTGGGGTGTPRAGWTELVDHQVGGSWFAETQYRLSADTAADMTAPSTGYQLTGIIVELNPAPAGGSAAVTGTGAAGVTGTQVRTDGTKTLITTLTGDAFSATDATAKQAIIDSWVAASSPTWGWNAVRAQIPTSAVVFTGNTIATFTIPALPDFQSDTTLTLTQTVPGAILTLGSPIVAAPTVAITRTSTDLSSGLDTETMDGTATRTRP